MTQATAISSLQNPRIKNVVKLRDLHHRDAQRLMIVEGYRPIRRALDNGYPLAELYVCPELFLGSNEAALIAEVVAQGATLFELTRPVFEKIAYRDRPEGLLAVAPQRRRRLADLAPVANGLYLVAEAIEKPGNLGTMLRSADAAGVTALILCDGCTDLFNPNVVAASIGTLFTVPVAEATTDECLAWCRQHGIQILAATPHTDKVYFDIDMRQGVAIVVGTEQYGLSDRWMKECDLQVVIPMHGQADSLNVAASTTLLLYEAVRQRR
jgi:RNA methyltransferase, TrmH family